MPLPPLPTYAEVSISTTDKRTGETKNQFNPAWLGWFLSLTGGGLSEATDHERLAGLLGGSGGEHYHLDAAQHAGIFTRNTSLPSAITPGASPFLYTNNNGYDMDVIVKGGTVTKLEFSRDEVTFYDVGVIAGLVHLSPGDSLRVTYTVAPTMTGVPR